MPETPRGFDNPNETNDSELTKNPQNEILNTPTIELNNLDKKDDNFSEKMKEIKKLIPTTFLYLDHEMYMRDSQRYKIKELVDKIYDIVTNDNPNTLFTRDDTDNKYQWLTNYFLDKDLFFYVAEIGFVYLGEPEFLSVEIPSIGNINKKVSKIGLKITSDNKHGDFVQSIGEPLPLHLVNKNVEDENRYKEIIAHEEMHKHFNENINDEVREKFSRRNEKAFEYRGNKYSYVGMSEIASYSRGLGVALMSDQKDGMIKYNFLFSLESLHRLGKLDFTKGKIGNAGVYYEPIKNLIEIEAGVGLGPLEKAFIQRDATLLNTYIDRLYSEQVKDSLLYEYQYVIDEVNKQGKKLLTN